MGGIFGTDGIRGTTGFGDSSELLLTPEFVLQIGRAVGMYVRANDSLSKHKVVIGRDTRSSGVMLEYAITAGLLAQGIDVLSVDVVPTAAVPFLVRHFDAKLGIMLTASHNPADDNGIKFFGADGYKLYENGERFIEQVISENSTYSQVETTSLGRVENAESYQKAYIEYLLKAGIDLSGVTVVLECANGATSYVAPEVFRRLGANVHTLNSTPNGININDSYEYLDPVTLRDRVIQIGADVGFAFDGDGDRVVMINASGDILDGDDILALLAIAMNQQGRLPHSTIATTNMSNLGLASTLRRHGIKVIESDRVGDKYVLSRMLQENLGLGGERAGHILILDGVNTTGDGIYTAITVLRSILSKRLLTDLSGLMPAIDRYPQYIGSASIPASMPPLDEIVSLPQLMNELQEILGETADINVRYSGTENKVRLSIRLQQVHSHDSIKQFGNEFLQKLATVISEHDRIIVI